MKKVAIIPGDGIGIEVIEGAIKVLKKSEKFLSDVTLFDFHYFDWGTDYYLKNDEMMPENALDVLSKFDSILLGAVGDTDSVLKNASNLDFVIIREYSEGEYANIGGFLHSSNEFETSIQTAVFTRMGCTRIIEYAFEHAISRNNKLKVTSITKSNAQAFGMVMWDNCFNEVSERYPNIATESLLVDAACMDLVRRPEDFDVIVASNLFGDILSDLGAGITGGMGTAPSSNINPSKNLPSMFEPVHGSAPDISGKGIANPLAAILSAAMMASYLGYSKIEDIIRQAVQKTINDNIITKDMRGNNSTEEVIKNVELNIIS